MINKSQTPLEVVAAAMYKHGAAHVIYKLLANNDNSKNQIYFGGDFDVLRIIPHGDLIGEISQRDGTIFKASLKLSWLSSNLDNLPAPAPNAQLIFYPRYPEVRMSGFLSGCAHPPSNLMQPPTKEERFLRENTPRCLILGICSDGRILAFTGAWASDISLDACERIQKNRATKVGSVFYEVYLEKQDSRDELLLRLREIHLKGFITSRRLDSTGLVIPYVASNGAGYTLECLFGISPNSRSEPDFMGWELKAHSVGPVTLMTPEPDLGSYRDNLSQFLLSYGKNSGLRRDFTGKHQVGLLLMKTGLMLCMEGFDPVNCEVSNPNGGLILRDQHGNIAAGWSFNKLISHWSKKHSQTAYVTYKKIKNTDNTFYKFGPQVILCKGAELKLFLNALSQGIIYYDPGINQKLIDNEWVSKKEISSVLH